LKKTERRSLPPHFFYRTFYCYHSFFIPGSQLIHPTSTGFIKRKFITGSSRGIEAAIAARLAGNGYAVVINYSGNAEAAEALLSSSIVGLLQPTYGVYAATKAAVEAMTGILAKELRGRNITVNAIAPGPTATDLFFHGKPQEVIDRLAKLTPLERLGQSEDIAAAVAFLAGPDGSWINGQTLRANGGII
jgi:NAD(P)-dependent dehydrogenase (short-subunit alcohol dehydrogenase family)